MDSKEKFNKRLELERLKFENHNSASNEADMLRGNKNRMFVCDDIKELDEHLRAAKIRIERIYELNKERLQIQTELDALYEEAAKNT